MTGFLEHSLLCALLSLRHAIIMQVTPEMSTFHFVSPSTNNELAFKTNPQNVVQMRVKNKEKTRDAFSVQMLTGKCSSKTEAKNE